MVKVRKAVNRVRPSPPRMPVVGIVRAVAGMDADCDVDAADGASAFIPVPIPPRP